MSSYSSQRSLLYVSDILVMKTVLILVFVSFQINRLKILFSRS